MAKLKLGIIGMSDGNGHPFSWSSIINGYSTFWLSKCGYPDIFEYMQANQKPLDCIKFAEVTRVYSQNKFTSLKIARCSNIEKVVFDTQEMVNQVDAILLARDDAENHMFYAKDALLEGVPIFIDKPIALSVDDLDRVYNEAQNTNMIFSCSALRFAEEILLNVKERENIGKLKEINCKTPKSWDKYAVHLIDPLIHMLDEVEASHVDVLLNDGIRKQLKVFWSNGVCSTIETDMNYVGPISFTYVGSSGVVTKFFLDSYNAFKDSLTFFMMNVSNKKYFDEYKKLRKVVDLIEKGRSL